MKIISTLTLLLGMCLGATAQTTITNGGFELWGNTVPSGDTYTEPTNWYSNQSGSSIAALGAETCFKDATVVHTGSYSVRLETISGPLSTVINGSVTTGVINAPSFTKSDGYIGTVNYSTASDDRRMNFTGRPDSLVGWYQYTQSTMTTGTGGANEQFKIRAILHTGDYYDPETPTTYHPDPTANKIADVTFLGPMSNVSSWMRFSVPFNYVSASSPAYIMINATPSANQLTTVTGSKLWLDDLEVVYVTASTCNPVTGLAASAITSTSATISWSAVTGSVGYIYAVDNNIAPPTSGIYTTATSVPVTGLTAGTSYYAHVKDSCGVGSASSWVTVPFTTTSASGCDAPTTLTVASITTNSATVSWTLASGAIAAEYVINTTAADPTTAGTAITTTTYNATALTPATLYYAHVRDSCGATSLSAWVTTPFTTLSTTGFNNTLALGFGVTAYPNPVKDEVTINISGVENISGRMELMDLSGRIIKTEVVSTDVVNISMAGLTPGIYVIRYSDAKHTQTIKVSKQ